MNALTSSQPPGLVEALGQSDAFLAFMERLSAVARLDRPVCILGERGSGKELAATRLHYLSGRWRGPLVTVNCAALPPELLASELFGHVEGAFTGAVRRRAGRFEAAHGGTLFLDEIAAAPMALQERLLRAVEYGVFERLGSSETLRADVRVVAATNADLPALAAAGRFKPDLLDRLAFEVLHLPPLRARQGDIELLAGHFAARFAAEAGLDPGRGKTPGFSPAAMAELLAHDWPGNVRELKNAVERSLARAGKAYATKAAIDPFAAPFAPPAQKTVPRQAQPTGDRGPDGLAPDPDARRDTADGQAARETRPDRSGRTDGTGRTGDEATAPRPAPALPCSLEREKRALERELLEAALAAARHNRRRAAELLGLTYDQLRGLRRRHGI